LVFLLASSRALIPTRKTDERLPLPMRRRSPVLQRTDPHPQDGHALLV